MRNFIFALILLLAILFLIGSMSEVQQVFNIFGQGDWRFLALAILAEGAWLVNVSASYGVIYRLMDIKERNRRLFLLSTAANFVNIITPMSGGMTGGAIFMSDGRKRGHPGGKVMVAWAIYYFFEYIGVLSLATLGFAVLFRRGNLHWTEISAALVLLAVAIGVAVFLYLGMEVPVVFDRVLTWLARNINRVKKIFTRGDLVSEERAHSFALDASEGMKVLRQNITRLWLPLLLAWSNKALLVVIFTLVFLAFNVPFSVGTIIAGVSIGYLFVIVSPTPSGIGIVEGIMILGLTSLRVSLESATVITFSFRGVTFWLPLLLGIITFRRVQKLQ
jgi:glycosyltransferase 2 family protein